MLLSEKNITACKEQAFISKPASFRIIISLPLLSTLWRAIAYTGIESMLAMDDTVLWHIRYLQISIEDQRLFHPSLV